MTDIPAAADPEASAARSASANGPMLMNPELKRYWDAMARRRAEIDPAELGSSDIAVVYSALRDREVGSGGEVRG